MTRTRLLLGAGALAAAALVVALVVFQPWLLFVNVTVNDALPTATSPAATPSESESPAAAGPVLLLSGTFVSNEHETTGTVSVIGNPDGSRVLALENLATSNGPDVHVWLSAADAVEGVDGWFLAGGAAHHDLGVIKGNVGNQVYEIPAEVDLTGFRSVTLWCEQFAVSFGAAQLV